MTNNNGNIIQINTASLNITLNSEKAGKAVGVFVGEALAKDGVKKVAIASDGVELLSVPTEDSSYYHPIVDETPVIENTMQLALTIQKPSLEDGAGHKWTMSDGEASLQFAMEDEEFIGRIVNGEAFRMGDILVCDVRFTQTKQGQKLKIERAIVKVHDHRAGNEQSEMDV